MPITIDVDIQSRPLSRKIDRILQYLKEDMDTWVEPYLKQRVPVDTGNMRRSFISDVTKDLHGNELYRWGFTAPYARIVAKRERYVDERAVILRAKRSLRRAVARVNAEGRR